MEKIFRKNPFAPQLKTHRLEGKLKDFWSFSIDYHYVILFEFINKNIVWFHSVGTHDIYG
ncbi:MAG: type II toxin-antitoxin system YafQ family toxin [Microgenomates group bacterium]